ncbi:hypothetical protein BH09SUM1_BH09SUM1_28460 [soil metagenome]
MHIRKIWPSLPLLLLSLAFYFGVVRYFGQAYIDDTFISLRYSKNFLNGAGITWNPGEAPVEGYTSLAWVLFTALASGGNTDKLLSASVHGSMFWGGALIVLAWVVAVFCLRIRPLLAVLLPLHLGVSPFLARHGGSGMETTLAAFAMMMHAGLVVLAVRNPTAKWAVILGLSAGLLPMVRPDAIFFAAPSAIAAIALPTFLDRRKMMRLILIFGATAGAIIGGFLLWKLRYYGNVVPIPAVFKTGFHEVVRHPAYIVSHWLTFATAVAVPAAIIALGAATDRAWIDRPVLVVLVGVIPFALYFLTALPVKSFEFRYLFPAYGIIFLLALAVLNNALPRKLDARGFAAFALVFIFCNSGYLSGVHQQLEQVHERYRKYSTLGRELSRIPNLSIALTEAGQLPYYSNAKVIDLLGLNDRMIARNRFRGAAFAADFRKYLETETGLPDVYMVSGMEASWASLAVQRDLLIEKYIIVSEDPVVEGVRKDAPHATELIEILRKNPVE